MNRTSQIPVALASLVYLGFGHAVLAQSDPAPLGGATPAPAATVAAEPQREPQEHSLQLGVRAGVVIPQPFNKLDANFLVEVEGAYQLPFLHKRLGIFLDVGYTQPTLSGTVNDPSVGTMCSGGTCTGTPETHHETIRDLGFTLGAHYWHPVSDKFLIYGGIGGRLHLTHTITEASAGTAQFGTNTEDSTRIGVMLRVGAGYKIGPGAIVLEAHFEYVGIDHLITGGERQGESANTANLALQLGYQFMLL